MGEQTAHREQGCAYQLRQIFLRKDNLKTSIHGLTNVLDQPKQLATEARGNVFGADLTKTHLQFIQSLEYDGRDVSLQGRETPLDCLELAGFPNQGSRVFYCYRCCAMTLLGKALQAEHIAWSNYTQYDFCTLRTQLEEFHRAGGQKHDLLHKVALEENCFPARNFHLACERDNRFAVFAGYARKQ